MDADALVVALLLFVLTSSVSVGSAGVLAPGALRYRSY